MIGRYGLAIVIGVSAALLCGVNFVAATEFRTGSVVSVHDAELLDDVIAGGDDISFEGHVLGDVIAAGRTITLGDSAVVDNSFMGFAQKVDVNGTVINSARVFAQDFTLRGHVERNVMAFCQSLLIDTRAWVEKDVSFGCAQMIVRGRVGGNLSGGATNVTISGQIDGDARVEGENIVILQSAIIGGQLRYASDREIKIEDGAQILGGVERISEEEANKDDAGYTLGSFFWDAWWYLGSLVVGAIMIALWRRFMGDVSATITRSSLKTLGIGALFLICLPIAAVAVALTLIGVPVAIMIALVWVVLLYLSNIFVGLALGEWLLARLRKGVAPRPFIALTLGLLLVTFLVALPGVGGFLNILVAALAMGGFFLVANSRRATA